MINRSRSTRAVFAAALGIVLLASCATEPEPSPPPAPTGTVNPELADATCGWWDRLIGVVLAPEAIRCAVLDGADAFWRAVAQFYFRFQHMDIAANYLEHSLESSPSTITNDPALIAKLRVAPEVTSAFRDLPIGHYDNHDLELTLTSSDDLLFAIHRASAHVTGDRTATSANFQVVFHDRYDFTDNNTGSLATRFGVTLAQLSVFSGTITPYDINATFTFTATYAAPDPCSNAGNGLYCGSSRQNGFTGGNPQTLFNCQAHHTASQATCATSCVVAPPGQPDFCASDPCTHAANGLFCWNSTQGGFSGNGVTNDLYTCGGGHTSSREACSLGCTIAPPGVPDHCTAPSCGGALSCGSHCCGASATFCGRNNACCDGVTCTANCPC